MKRAFCIALIICAVVALVSCEVGGMTIDELIRNGGRKSVSPKYTGLSEWESAECAVPTVTYKGVDGTDYAESETAPTLTGKYVAVFTITEPDTSVSTVVEVPFEL